MIRRFTILVVGNDSLRSPSAFVVSGREAPVPAPDPVLSWTTGQLPITGPGDYSVILDTGNAPLSAKLVTGFGGGSRCNYANSISGGLEVRCYDLTGAATDQQFSVLQVAGGRTGRRIGFAFANSASTPSYTPLTSTAFNSSGGAITATRSAVGHCAVNFAGLQTLPGHTNTCKWPGWARSCGAAMS